LIRCGAQQEKEERYDVMTAGSGTTKSQEVKKSPRWDIAGDVLRVLMPDGTELIPSADEIYRIAIENEDISGLPKPVSILGHGEIGFSRYPLALEVRIESDQHGRPPGLKAVVYAVGGSEQVALDDFHMRDADHLVVNHQWYPLARGALEESRAIFTAASIADSGEVSLKQYLKLLQLVARYPAIKDRSGDSASALRQKAPEGSILPVSFSGSLYPYQKDGWRWLQLVSSQEVGGILADEMGLGKTVQIAVLLAAESEAARHPSLVVATGTLLENWRRELAKFAPALQVMIHRGADRTGFPADLASVDVVVTSYDTLIRDLSIVRQIQWNIVVLDEAQAIKNPETKRASAAKRIPRRVGIAVTGTPVENRLTDLWSIADFALPGFLGDLGGFERTFPNDEDGAAALEPLVSPILLRRRIAEVAEDLPPRIDIPQALELSDDQAEAYEAVRQSIIDEYGKTATLVALTRLRMFCAHPELLGTATGDPAATSAKYERLVEILEEILHGKEKAIIFTSFNEMTDILVKDLTDRFDVPTAFIDGRTPMDARQQTVDIFGSGSGGSILVLNPRAAGTGLNITAANHVIHYNLEWNPAVEDQASARAYRRGQTRPVTVHRLFYVDTVEETIDDRLAAKRLLSGKAVVGTDGSQDNIADIAAALSRSPVRKGATHASQ
jgi:SNF2 family DNA or RNA helicase